MVPLKYLSNFWRILEMPLINYDINIFLTQSAECIIKTETGDNQETKFARTDTKLYVLFVAISAQDNAKLLQQLKQVLKEQ